MAALHDASQRFIDQAESISPEQASLPVAGLEWSVGETIAHVLTVVRRGYADRRRSATAAETAALNQICLDEVADRDPASLAAELRDAVHTALDLVYPKIPDDREFPFHGGVMTTMTPALHVVLAEFLVHGYDIAHAIGRPWPISEHEAMLTVPGELMGAWLRPDVPDEHYELRLGAAPPVSLSIIDGRLLDGAHDADGRAAAITADPVTLVLTFYGRLSTSDPALTRLLSRFVPA